MCICTACSDILCYDVWIAGVLWLGEEEGWRLTFTLLAWMQGLQWDVHCVTGRVYCHDAPVIGCYIYHGMHYLFKSRAQQRVGLREDLGNMAAD